MEQMQFSVAIRASKGRVWQTLWQDETFRQWASVIDPGTYMVGELKEGNEVQFISSESGYGVTSLVAGLINDKYLLIKHRADTQDRGELQRDDEWTGGEERYTLTEHDGTTTLRVALDVPTKLAATFAVSYPKALDCVKLLAERKP
jgi:hypothetical protein